MKGGRCRKANHLPLLSLPSLPLGRALLLPSRTASRRSPEDGGGEVLHPTGGERAPARQPHGRHQGAQDGGIRWSTAAAKRTGKGAGEKGIDARGRRKPYVLLTTVVANRSRGKGIDAGQREKKPISSCSRSRSRSREGRSGRDIGSLTHVRLDGADGIDQLLREQ